MPDKCGLDVDDSHILFVADEEDFCASLISSHKEKNYTELINHRKPKKGFIINTLEVDFDVELRCQRTLKTPAFALTYDGLRVETQDACGSMNQLARIFNRRKQVLSLMFLLIGIVLMFAGGYRWDLLISYIGFLVGFSFMFLFFWGFVEYDEQTTTYLWMALVASAVGMVISYLLHTFVLLSYGLVGFFLGFCVTKGLLAYLDLNITEVSLPVAGPAHQVRGRYRVLLRVCPLAQADHHRLHVRVRLPAHVLQLWGNGRVPGQLLRRV